MSTNAFWQKNIEALKKKDPELARRLVAVSMAGDTLFAARARDGSPLLGMRLDNGQAVAFAHTQTPGVEAEDWVLSLGEPFLKRGHAMLVGFGSLYHPLMLFRLSDEETVLWFVEPDPAVFKYALHLMDFESLIASDRVFFTVGMDAKETARRLTCGIAGNRMTAQGIRIAFHGVAGKLYESFLGQLKENVYEIIQMQGVRFRTSEEQGRVILGNVMENLPSVIQGAPSLRLMGLAAGIPALVVAPGPSLEEALPRLAELRKNALLISVDTAHRILHRRGIGSDLVVSLDYTELNVRHFERIDADDALLVAFPGVNMQIPAKYKGRTFFFDHAGNIHFTAGATQILSTLRTLGPLGKLITYGSTAHAAYHLARTMGCYPIALVGNDLSFPNDRAYATGAMQNDLAQDPARKEERLPVPSNDGGTVITSGLYKIYLTDFPELIRGTGGYTLNASRNGAKIEGAPYMALEDIAESWMTQPVDKAFLAKALTPTLESQSPAVVEELSHLAELCEETLEALERIEKQANKIKPKDSQFRQNMILRMKSFLALNEGREYAMLDLVSSLCARSIVSVLGQVGDISVFGGDTPEQNEQAKRRCLDLLADVRQALDTFQQEFIKGAENLQKALMLPAGTEADRLQPNDL